tara:strand:- start:526 stop:1134 length:609 start_codon:yes stop_codon:yes gene_type:complete
MTFFIRYFFYFLILFNFSINGKSVTEINDDDFVIGDLDAPITIIEYASLSCSHCADFHVNKLPKLIEEFVDTGKAKIVFRDFPFNWPALVGSMVLRCVPSELRYQYTDALYQLQSRWVVRDKVKIKQELYKIMQSGGMTKAQFNECLGNKELENLILQGIINAQEEFNIKSTPSFIINGKLLEGNKPIKDFRQIIDKILSEE